MKDAFNIWLETSVTNVLISVKKIGNLESYGITGSRYSEGKPNENKIPILTIDKLPSAPSLREGYVAAKRVMMPHRFFCVFLEYKNTHLSPNLVEFQQFRISFFYSKVLSSLRLVAWFYAAVYGIMTQRRNV